MHNNILIMDESLLTIVVSTVKVELIGKEAGDGKLYCINCNYTLFNNDGITMDGIWIGASGTAPAIAATINLTAIEWREIVIIASRAVLFLV